MRFAELTLRLRAVITCQVALRISARHFSALHISVVDPYHHVADPANLVIVAAGDTKLLSATRGPVGFLGGRRRRRLQSRQSVWGFPVEPGVMSIPAKPGPRLPPFCEIVQTCISASLDSLMVLMYPLYPPVCHGEGIWMGQGPMKWPNGANSQDEEKEEEVLRGILSPRGADLTNQHAIKVQRWCHRLSALACGLQCI